METTTEYLSSMLETTTFESSNAYAPLLAAAADILSDSASDADFIDHQDAAQITFEIPSHSDMERIQNLDTFSTLLRRLGNTVYQSGSGVNVAAAGAAVDAGATVAMSADGHAITNEQISHSVVLNLADLKHTGVSGLERFFQGADMHSIINYLWIGVVTALIVLSVIFIVFSVYFYRKFRQWKKCNKDIRAHMNNDMYTGGNASNHHAPCDTLLPLNGQSTDAAYYQLESPPCYTIATGLPTYDEALHHQHFSFGMKCVLPALAAVHHHPAIAGNSHWEKSDASLHMKQQQQQQPQLQLQQQQQQLKSTTLLHAAPAAHDAAAALLTKSSDACVSIDMLLVEAATNTSTTNTVDIDSSCSNSNADNVVVVVA